MLISSNSGTHSGRPGKPRFSLFEAAEFLAKLGFEAIDVNFCRCTYQEPFEREDILDGDNWKEEILRLKDKLAELNLVPVLSHQPFRYDYKSPIPAYEHEMMFRAIDACSLLGIPYTVVHPLREKNEEKTMLIDKTVEVFTPIQKYAAERGVCLAMENMFNTTADELVEIVDRVGCAACWDTGHANFGHQPQGESIRKLGHRLKALHINDNFGQSDNHTPPFLGTTNWPEVMQALKDINYDGPFNYEVMTHRLPDENREEYSAYLVKTAKYLLSL